MAHWHRHQCVRDVGHLSCCLHQKHSWPRRENSSRKLNHTIRNFRLRHNFTRGLILYCCLKWLLAFRVLWSLLEPPIDRHNWFRRISSQCTTCNLVIIDSYLVNNAARRIHRMCKWQYVHTYHNKYQRDIWELKRCVERCWTRAMCMSR